VLVLLLPGHNEPAVTTRTHMLGTRHQRDEIHRWCVGGAAITFGSDNATTVSESMYLLRDRSIGIGIETTYR
jgi:hypothetical protein